MKINLITIGKRMPAWVESGFNEYAKRLPNYLSLNLIEITAGKRTKGANIEQLIQREGEQMLAAIPVNNDVIALEVLGQKWDTPMLAKKLQDWQASGCDISLLIGGPEGLAKACVARAEIKWSLSPLTLPHPLVRIVVAEQLYRAWSLSVGHPYSK